MGYKSINVNARYETFLLNALSFPSRLSNPATFSMLLGYNPVLQALLGTFLTWGLTAAGSALVFVFSSGQVGHHLQFLFSEWVEIL